LAEVIFPIEWPEVPDDPPGRAYGGHEGHGIVRVSINPPVEKRFYRSWKATLRALFSECGIDVGQTVVEQFGRNGIGAYLLRVGKHPRYGLVSAAVASGPISLVATYEMGNLDKAKEDIDVFAEAVRLAEIRSD